MEGNVVLKRFFFFFNERNRSMFIRYGNGPRKWREIDAEERGRIAREISLWH